MSDVLDNTDGALTQLTSDVATLQEQAALIAKLLAARDYPKLARQLELTAFVVHRAVGALSVHTLEVARIVDQASKLLNDAPLNSSKPS